jgi:hypothetical protein
MGRVLYKDSVKIVQTLDLYSPGPSPGFLQFWGMAPQLLLRGLCPTDHLSPPLVTRPGHLVLPPSWLQHLCNNDPRSLYEHIAVQQ